MVVLPQTVLNVRYGTIAEDNKPTLDWAKLSFVEDEPTINDGFAGIKVAELKVTSESNNKLAKELHTKIAQGEIKLPCFMDLQVETHIKGKDVTLCVVGYEIK